MSDIWFDEHSETKGVSELWYRWVETAGECFRDSAVGPGLSIPFREVFRLPSPDRSDHEGADQECAWVVPHAGIYRIFVRGGGLVAGQLSGIVLLKQGERLQLHRGHEGGQGNLKALL